MPYLLKFPPVETTNKDGNIIKNYYNRMILGVKFANGEAMLNGGVLDRSEEEIIDKFMAEWPHVEITEIDIIERE